VKSKILHQFHCLPFVFLVFLTSFFPISRIQTCQTILNNFLVLYYTEYRFYQRILENSWIFIKKKWRYSQYKTFPKFHHLQFVFWSFSIFDIFFSILPIYRCQRNSEKFWCSFLVWIQDFIKEFYKTMVFSSKNWDLWHPKFKQNSIVYNFIFIFIIFDIFYSYFTDPNLSKSYGIFCGVFFWKD